MSRRELCFLSLVEQARLIRRRDVSPVEVVDSTLRQIQRIDERVNAFITVTGDAAMSMAREAEREIARGGYRGSLHGIPIALKDLFATRGVRTTAGSKLLGSFVPAEDATVVARLRDAGAILIGKNSMHEFAYGVTNINPHYGDVRNPWDLDRITGGSSGGSAAAVAASMCSAALGSDTGGSIRIPAALCGVVGLKPTYGRVSRHGAIPCAWSLDHVGPLARTAEDAALVLEAMAGWDPKDPASSREPVPDYAAQLARDVSGLRIAVLQQYATDSIRADVVAGFRRALEVLRALGMVVEDVSIPELEGAIGASSAILSAEASAYHEKRLRARSGDFGGDVRARLEQGLLVSATDYLKAQRVRALLMDRFRALFRRYDAVVCPTVPITAPKPVRETIRFGGTSEPRGATLVRHTRLFNLTGMPAVSVPCGFAANGLPVALQIAGAPFSEGTLLQVAHAYQRSSGWHLVTPLMAASLS